MMVVKKMIKTIRVMLIPNNKQNTKLFRYANTARFAYNWALGREKENYKNGGKFLSDSDLRKEFTQLKKTEEYSWLNEVSNNVTKQAIKDACHAYKRFFKGCSKFPKFKSRKFSIPSFYQDNVKIQFSDTHIKIEGFAASKKKNKQKINWIRLAEKNRIPTDCNYSNPRIRYDGINWIYATLRSALRFGLAHRWSFVFAMTGLLLLSVFGYQYMRQGFFPDMVYDQLYMEYKLPEGNNYTRVVRDLEEIETYLKGREEITHVTTSIGGTPGRYNLVRSIANPSLRTAN